MFRNVNNKFAINYSAIINDHPQLEAEEEYEYLAKAKQGDKRARDILIFSNLRYVLSFISKYKTIAFESDELINEAITGMLKAIDKFDLSSNVRFITYTHNWIRTRVNRAINNTGSQIRIPESRLADKIRIQTYLHRNQIHDGDQLDFLKISNELEIKINIIKDIIPLVIKHIETTDFTMDISMLDVNDSKIMNHNYYGDNLFKNVENKLLVDQIFKEANLNAKQIDILYRFYGNEETLQEIANDMNRSKQAIEQNKARAMVKVNKIIKHY